MQQQQHENTIESKDGEDKFNENQSAANLKKLAENLKKLPTNLKQQEASNHQSLIKWACMIAILLGIVYKFYD